MCKAICSACNCRAACLGQRPTIPHSSQTRAMSHATACWMSSFSGRSSNYLWDFALFCSGVQQQEQPVSGLLGRSLYRPPGAQVSNVSSIAEEDSLSRSPSLGPPSRKSSTLSMRSSLASNPLLRSSTDFSAKISSPLQRPSHLHTLLVRSPPPPLPQRLLIPLQLSAQGRQHEYSPAAQTPAFGR